MTKQDAQDAISRYGSQRAAATAMRVSRKTLRKALEGGGTASKAKSPAVISAAQPKRKTLTEFRAQYDKATIVPAKIKAAIKAMGPSGWDYEVAFARSAGVSLTDLANFREPFAHHVVTLNKENRRVWAGSPAMAKQMREML